MTQADLIKRLALSLGITQVEVKRLLKSSTKIITETLDQDIGISIPKLGTFSTETFHRRKSFSPFHKQFVLLAPKRTIKFNPSVAIKKELKSVKPEL